MNVREIMTEEIALLIATCDGILDTQSIIADAVERAAIKVGKDHIDAMHFVDQVRMSLAAKHQNMHF